MRLSLLPNILRKVRENLRHTASFDVLEIGDVFQKGTRKDFSIEKKKLALVHVGPSGENRSAFFSLKGKVESFLRSFDIEGVSFIPGLSVEPFLTVSSVFHPTRTAVIMHDGTALGIMGEIHPAIAKASGTDPKTVVAEFDMAAVMSARRLEKEYVPIRRFPYAMRDISLAFPKHVTVALAEALLREAGAPLLRSHELFDIYEQGEEKNFAFHLAFGAPDRTLSKIGRAHV